MEAVSNIHASAIAIDGAAVLIVGPSGAGKSDLALRLIDRGAKLIADDRVEICTLDGQLTAYAPTKIAGLIEVRDLGIVTLPHVSGLPVELVVELGIQRSRLPDADQTADICGCQIATIRLDSREASAAIKVEHALLQALSGRKPALARIAGAA